MCTHTPYSSRLQCVVLVSLQSAPDGSSRVLLTRSLFSWDTAMAGGSLLRRCHTVYIHTGPLHHAAYNDTIYTLALFGVT